MTESAHAVYRCGRTDRLLSCSGSISLKALLSSSFHKWPMLHTHRECVIATKINVVIKPVGQLLSVTLDHPLRERLHVHQSVVKTWTRRSALETNPSSNFDALPVVSPVSQKSSLSPTSCITEVEFVVHHTLGFNCCWSTLKTYYRHVNFKGATSKIFTVPWHWNGQATIHMHAVCK